MTYTNVPNGFTECLPCSVCDPNNGLREKQACTSTSDTLCGPLTHYYCVDQLFNCKKAIKHSTCSPGQYINQTEYEVEERCCPMCAPGTHVLWHCTQDKITTCVPCLESTFISELNGLMNCFPCTICDASRGLRVNKGCSQSSDTVCEPLERFYCIVKKKSSCTSALQHSKCRPGQYIKQAGTSSTDTVCADCTGDTYSNGSFSSCLPHTKCEAMRLTEKNPGTHSSDTECGKPYNSLTIIAPSVIVTLTIITCVSVFSVTCFCKRKRKRSVVGGKIKS
ncbi:uncharacterized protein LOC751714 isoform 1 [Danio rerio]|uniref:Uncharacterized protein LOC751714 isoform 1 n=1 Tax=Danio rerio TaxID=7955 RepID=A0A8M1N9J0_DANRE